MGLDPASKLDAGSEKMATIEPTMVTSNEHET